MLLTGCQNPEITRSDKVCLFHNESYQYITTCIPHAYSLISANSGACGSYHTNGALGVLSILNSFLTVHIFNKNCCGPICQF